MCARRLGHPPAGIGRKRLQVSSGAFRIEDAQSQGRFAGSGHTGDSNNLVERNIHINILEVMYSCAAHLHAAGKDLLVVCHGCIPSIRWY